MEDSTQSGPLAEQIQRFIPFDELSPEALAEISTHFRTYEIAARKILFKRGKEDDECHFLLAGEIDLTDDQFRVTSIAGDDDENFLALDSSHPIHRSTAISKTPCQLFAIKRQLLELITTWSELRQSYEMDESESDWLEALLTSELFNRIPPGNIQKLLSRFNERLVSLGDEIIRQDEEGNECFVIKTGKALVTRKDNNKTETLAALGKGALFGEDALISNMPRNATVTMSSDGVLMSLTKEDFDTLLKAPILEFVSQSDLDDIINEGDTGTVLLDVRQAREASLNPIPRAKCIPLGILRSRLHQLSRSFQYVICGAGRAEAAAYILTEAGYQAKVLIQETET
ncbi:MAG: calcium-binding protein [Oceanospirillaceae bacterium]|nr:calcium-binding protein [Oceanospirillaceae bacterium]MBT11288.1 calcium-binding protein [Oceanospirillaceae bacterium]|tara:strand:- start:81644 stop:82672 length:1029 start_codon:yes stop_codon:yes gene_type:complete